MKKPLCLLVSAGLLLMTGIQLRSQDLGVLNHVSVGVTAGTDAFGFQLAVPVTNHLALRAGYVTSLGLAYDRTVRVDMDATWDESDFSVHDDVDLRGTWNVGDLRAILDIFPFRRSGFHLSVGAYYALQNTPFLGVGNTSPLPIDPAEYHKSGISINGQFVTTDVNGMVEAGVHVPAFRPYAGLGFGRSVHNGKRVTMTFDLGACYLGAPTLQTTDYYGKPVVITSESIQNLDEGWIDKVLGYAKVLPVVQLGLHIRLF